MSFLKKRNNFFSLDLSKYTKTNWKYLEKIIKIVEIDKLVIVSWMKNIWKTNFIKELINKTNANNNFFHYNVKNDLNNHIKTGEDLFLLLNEYIKLYKIPNYIILENISNIEWIEYFITKVHDLNYNTILIWNNIHIWGIKEIEILNTYEITDNNISEKLKYWSLNEISLLNNDELKKKFLQLITNDIFVNEIFISFWVKNINLYNFTLSYLSYYNNFFSLRELQRNLDKIKNISLKTVIDYVDFSLQVKIIKKVYKFDLKNNKEITTKAKYYFTDNWIRNSLSEFQTNKKTLIENLIFNKLEYNNYKIYSWLNWKFDFSFYWIKEKKNSHLIKSIYIHISEETKKEELKKEVNKLLKIWKKKWDNELCKKYLLVESIDKLGIKKLKYDNVEIVEINNFLIKF